MNLSSSLIDDVLDAAAMELTAHRSLKDALGAASADGEGAATGESLPGKETRLDAGAFGLIREPICDQSCHAISLICNIMIIIRPRSSSHTSSGARQVPGRSVSRLHGHAAGGPVRHMKGIDRPQDSFEDKVDNSNEPFRCDAGNGGRLSGG